MIIYCLFLSIDIPYSSNGNEWWTTPVRFGDWRNVKECDYVTNVPVHRWYSGKEAGNYRPQLLDAFLTQIVKGDTVSIGLDYYSMNISKTLVPNNIAQYYGEYLWKGGVVRMEACGQDSTITFWIP